MGQFRKVHPEGTLLKRRQPQNVRTMLNTAALVANDLIETLAPIAKSGRLFDAEERKNFEMATEALKTVRELYLKQQALKKHQAQIQNVVNFAQIEGASQDELRLLAAKLLINGGKNEIDKK